MRYLFTPVLTTSIQAAFESAIVRDEMLEYSQPARRDYFFIAFQTHPCVEYEEKIEKSMIDIILSGDKQLSQICNEALTDMATIECGFRWHGKIEKTKQIVFLGFCIKIIYTKDKMSVRHAVINRLCDAFKENELIKSTHDFAVQCHAHVTTVCPQTSALMKLSIPAEIQPEVLNAVRKEIEFRITPILPAYKRPNELSINPAYEEATRVKTTLHLHEKKIWLLRSDFILALGNKHAYWTSFAECGLPSAIAPELHQFINWEDRYGHPSLACAHPGFFGDAYYGGLLAQREGYLEIYTSSGRYYRNDLSDENKKLLEAYVAAVLQKAYGIQTVRFRDAPSCNDYYECAIFYHDGVLPEYCRTRSYDARSMQEIFCDVLHKPLGPSHK